MIIQRLLLSGFFLYSSLSFGQSPLSFHDSAAYNLPKKVEEIVVALDFINEETMPVQVKEVRKAVGNVKIEIDLYCPLYGQKRYESVIRLRDMLDLGYEHLGNFKDFYDTEVATGITATAKEIKKAREKVLTWRFQFEAFLYKSDVIALLASPLEKATSCKDAPKFLWGRLDRVPYAHDNFNFVVEYLIKDLNASYAKDQKKLLKIKNLLKGHNEEDFHDFRKGVRTMLKLIDFYPELTVSFSAEGKSELELLVDDFGAINDLLVSYHRMSGKKAEKLAREIDDHWEELKDKLEITDLSRLFP